LEEDIVFDKQIEQLSIEDIQMLIDCEAQEDRMVEYKSCHPLNNKTDKDKFEFAKDVSAFANTLGGRLIYGIKEDDDRRPISINPFTVDTIDELKTTLEQILSSKLEPKFAGCNYKFIKNNEGYILIIDVPKSYNVVYGVRKEREIIMFYGRANGRCEPYNYYEIRDAFLSNESLGNKIKIFHENRLNKIIIDESPVLLKNNARIILHVTPLSAFHTRQSFNIENFYNDYINLYPIPLFHGLSRRRNIEGIVVYDDPDEKGKRGSYVQLYRNGKIESVDAVTIKSFYPREKDFVLNADYEYSILQAVSKYIKALQQIGIQPPIYVSLAFTGMKGARISKKQSYDAFNPNKIFDRDTIVIPELEITEFSSSVCLEEVLKDTFNMVWNACDMERSLNYDENGKMISKK
jgi:hypothetical protein